MGNIYITRDELRNPPYNILTEEVDNTYLELLQDLTKDIIDSLTDKTFSQEGSEGSEVEKLVDGTGKDTVFLPKRLISLDSVRIYSSNGVYTEYASTNFTFKPKYVSFNYYSDSLDDVRISYEMFPEGSGNVGIVGIWGYASVPNPIKYLQGKMIEKMLEDGSYAEKYKSVKIGDFSAQLLYDEMDSLLGENQLDIILRLYRQEIYYGVV